MKSVGRGIKKREAGGRHLVLPAEACTICKKLGGGLGGNISWAHVVITIILILSLGLDWSGVASSISQATIGCFCF